LAAPLPRSVPDADRGVIYEFAMDTPSDGRSVILLRNQGHLACKISD
jgi:hypothetical protein